ncbi:glycosyltransferase [Flavobacterium rakeshii]|uniref:glycosyltransferase n=1 Tax=Flavobacterium rakeshii TaxID=1038845 RepID=UPI002E7B771F|nr:glycosyltransferase [Flavobacterium rakeshii]MEE1896850.1 glycosyltransferase [Flavobacterium rakeshii]
MENVLIVLPNSKLGGAEQILKMIAEYHKNDTVYVFFLSKRISSSWDNTNVNLCYSSFSNKLGAIFSLLFFLLRNNKCWDRIYTSHVNVTGVLGLFIRLRFFKKKKFIARESTTVFSRFNGGKLLLYKLIYFIGYSKVDLLICQTNDMKNQFVEALPKLSKKFKIVVFANPVALVKVFENEEYVFRSKDYIVSAGRLIPEKGYDILIESFSKLKGSGKYFDLQLIILGEGGERGDLLNKVKSLGLEDSVVFKGFVDNVYPYFKKAKLCVISSRIEGFPNVLLQMMSQNNKVVSTACAGGIQDIEGLFVCETNNKDLLADTMEKALDSNTDYCRVLFDKFLEVRSIDGFVGKIDSVIYEK